MTEPISGAQDLVAALEAAGVDVCFGLPGVHNLSIWSALRRSPIRLVGVRHEQTAAYAADGYARVSGRAGVALTTTGPGAANTLAAVGEAYASGSPIVVIATDIPATLRRPGVQRGVLHETRDQGAMFEPVVKEAIRVAGRAEIHAAVTRAVERALAAPAGPVYVEIPTDLLAAVGWAAAESPAPAREEDANHAAPGHAALGHAAPAHAAPAHAALGQAAPAHAAPGDSEIAEAARLLHDAARPLLWVGGGAARSRAEHAVAALAERLGAPVLETYAGRGLLSPGHRCNVGLPPHVPEAGDLWDRADVVLAIGTDFDGMMTQNWRMPAPPTLIAVNVDAEAAATAYPPAVTLVGDAGDVTRRLLAAVAPAVAADEPWAGDLPALRARALDRLATEDPVSATFLASLAAALPADATVVCDMCIPGYWTGAFHAFGRPRALAYPVGWGTLGFGFPASLGAALAGAGPTLCICGDGGFLFACGELATAMQERIPVCVLLVDDGGYGMLRYDQLQAGEQPDGTDLTAPDWMLLARSFGVEAERFDDPGAALVDALRRRVGAPEPSMIVLDAEMLPPPTTSPRWYRSASNATAVEVAA